MCGISHVSQLGWLVRRVMQADHDDKRGGARAVVRAREDTSAPETAPETPAKRAEMAGADETRQMIARNSLRLAEMESEMQSLRHRISEREKELACHMLLSNLLDEITQSSQHTASVLNEVVSILPPAMQYPDICAARIVLHSATYSSPNWKSVPHTTICFFHRCMFTCSQPTTFSFAGTRRGRSVRRSGARTLHRALWGRWRLRTCQTHG